MLVCTFLRGDFLVLYVPKAPLVKGSWRGAPEGLPAAAEKAPLSGVDSPCQGEMSRRDKRGRDAVSRRLTERLLQIWYDLSVSAFRRATSPFRGGFGLAHSMASPMRGSCRRRRLMRWTVPRRQKYLHLIRHGFCRATFPYEGKASTHRLFRHKGDLPCPTEPSASSTIPSRP